MSRPPITAKGEGLFRRQLTAALDYLESLGGGSGGPVDIADVTGLTAALAGKSDTGHTHAELATIPIKGTATVTVTNNSREWSEVVAATGVTGSSVVMLSVAPHADADENDAEMLDVLAMSATPGTDQITVKMAFDAPTRGAVKLNWMAA